MYFNKYYSFKTKEYIHKAVMDETELSIFKKTVKDHMKDVDPDKLLIKRFSLENEYKYISSPNSIGEDVLKEIEASGKKYYTLELTDSEMEELYERLFYATLVLKANYEYLWKESDYFLASVGKDIEKLEQEFANGGE